MPSIRASNQLHIVPHRQINSLSSLSAQHKVGVHARDIIILEYSSPPTMMSFKQVFWSEMTGRVCVSQSTCSYCKCRSHTTNDNRRRKCWLLCAFCLLFHPISLFPNVTCSGLFFFLSLDCSLVQVFPFYTRHLDKVKCKLILNA